MDCLFCKIIKGDIPSYTIYEDEYDKCFLDINPVSKGHTLVIPKKHFLDVNDIEEEYVLKVLSAAKKVIKLLNEKLEPTGIKLVQNNGSAQEVKHYHLHIIPCYGEKKESFNIEELYKKLTN